MEFYLPKLTLLGHNATRGHVRHSDFHDIPPRVVAHCPAWPTPPLPALRRTR